MSWHIVWTCAKYVRAQLECAYFLDLLDDGEDVLGGEVVGTVTVNHIETNLWRT